MTVSQENYTRRKIGSYLERNKNQEEEEQGEKEKQKQDFIYVKFYLVCVWEMNQFEAMVHAWFVQRLILVSHLSQLDYKLGDK